MALSRKGCVNWATTNVLLPSGLSFNASARSTNRLWLCSRKRNNKGRMFCLGKQLLDYIEGGPKLRKWYGAPDQRKREKFIENEITPGANEENAPEIRDAVLVTDGDSETGKALVKDVKAAVTAFGSYIEAINGDITDKTSTKRALRNVKAIICITQMGMLLEDENLKEIKHIVFLSKLGMLRGYSGIQAALSDKARRSAEAEENAVIACGVPYTIVRAGKLDDNPGGLGFNFKKGCAKSGTISREDAAIICVEALQSPPQSGLIFEATNGGMAVENWKELFASLGNNGAEE
eukprot:TRINITY_DN2139_c0_g1_i1.p1 TRINITY_DN2139_c0_g1~~TRINITY_DN2139_c0_g1_i1.p1  ORF type:complete len:320 (+),score=67.09 TRINITY_DN2139_c0_g1_i1:85-960(+)